jgi:hypothetical protein
MDVESISKYIRLYAVSTSGRDTLQLELDTELIRISREFSCAHARDDLARGRSGDSGNVSGLRLSRSS